MDKKDLNKLLTETYTEKSFGGETGLLAVREDPSRYITQADKVGIFNMFTEILDNSIDELREVITIIKGETGETMPRYIQVYLDNKTGSCVIEDQGRGIPITPADNHPDIPTLNAVFERDNMGSKGNKSGIEQVGYNIKTMGTHGAGAFVVTACSEYMRIYTTRYSEDTKRLETYYTEYNKGIPTENPDWIMNRVYKYPDPIQRYTGTRVEFKPDKDIMKLYNPNTKEMEDDYYILDMIKKRITDTLETLGEEYPIIINFYVEGEEVEVFDSRELSITYGLVEGEDYVKTFVTPDEEMLKEMEQQGVSDFTLEFIIKKSPNTERILKSSGYVNRIKVNFSPHIEELESQILNQIRFMSERDSDLRGFYDRDGVRGIEIISLLEVSLAHWDAQVKSNYTDFRVASYMSRALARNNVLTTSPIKDMIDYCYENSKPFLELKKKTRDREREIMKQREEEKLRLSQMRHAVEVVNDSISWLNLKDKTLHYSGNISNTTLIIVEGTSANSSLKDLRLTKPNLAIFDGLTGKIDNMRYTKAKFYDLSLNQMDERGLQIKPIHKLEVLFKAGFDRIGIMSDNDADGHHIRALLRFFISRRHMNLLDEGRVYEISPDFCGYRTYETLEYEFQGKKKVLNNSGTIRTELEYNLVRSLFPGKVEFTLYKGVGSSTAEDLLRIIEDEELYWNQVPPLTNKEKYMIEEFFTDSSQLKVSYTDNMYGEELRRKDRIKKIVYKDTLPDIKKIIQGGYTSSEPQFNRVSRVTLEDYEERGSALLEMQQIEQMLEDAKGNIFKY